MLGAIPKDIDIFVPLEAFPTADRRQALVRDYGALFGQTIRQKTDMSAYDGMAFEVYEMETNHTVGYEPINIIFQHAVDVDNIPYNFDFDICMFFIDAEDNVIRDCRSPMNRNSGDIRYLAPQRLEPRELELLVGHAVRIKEKYPFHRFLFGVDAVLNNPSLYLEMQRGGIIEQARAVLPTEGQDGTGDEVRLNAGTGAGPEAGVLAQVGGWIAEARAEREQREAARILTSDLIRYQAARQQVVEAWTGELFN